MSAPTTSDPQLPGMLGVDGPELGLRGWSLVVTIYGCGATLFWAFSSVEGAGSERLLLALCGAAMFAAMAFIAEGVRRYNCWAWFFVMAWLVLFFAPGFLLFAADSFWPVPVSYAFGMMTIGWIHWLWSHRGDFLPDPRIDSLRRRRRRVTAGWRTARLSGLAAAVPRRPAAPVAGALWAQRCGGAG